MVDGEIVPIEIDGMKIDNPAEYIKSLRSSEAGKRQEAADLAAKLKIFEDAKNEAERKKLEDEGKLKELLAQTKTDHEKELLKLEEQIKARDKVMVRTSVEKTAKELGFREDAIEKLPRLIDLRKIKVEDGAVSGDKELLEALLVEMPFLKADGGTGAGGAGGGTGGGVGKDGRPGNQPGKGGAADADVPDMRRAKPEEFKDAWAKLGK